MGERQSDRRCPETRNNQVSTNMLNRNSLTDRETFGFFLCVCDHPHRRAFIVFTGLHKRCTKLVSYARQHGEVCKIVQVVQSGALALKKMLKRRTTSHANTVQRHLRGLYDVTRRKILHHADRCAKWSCVFSIY